MSVSIYDAATEGTSLYTEEVLFLDSNGIYTGTALTAGELVRVTVSLSTKRIRPFAQVKKCLSNYNNFSSSYFRRSDYLVLKSSLWTLL